MSDTITLPVRWDTRKGFGADLLYLYLGPVIVGFVGKTPMTNGKFPAVAYEPWTKPGLNHDTVDAAKAAPLAAVRGETAP